MKTTPAMAAEDAVNRPAGAELKRTLRLGDLVFIVLGAVIGSGIFIVPSMVLQQTGGDVGPMLVVWLLAGVLSLLGALTYGELGAMKPEAGGLYVYVRDAFGPFPAFLMGWTFLFVIASGSLATLAVAFTSYFSSVVALSPAHEKLVPVVMISVIAAINIRGVREGATVGIVGTAIKAGAILLMSGLFIAYGDGFAQVDGHVWPERLEFSLLSGVGVAMIGVLWAYEGWQYVTFSAGEARDPARSFPAAIAIGTGGLILLYLLANVAYIAALGPAGMAGSSAVAADGVASLFGPAAGTLVAVTIMVAMFSAANANLLTGPRVYYRMGRDGVFFRKLGKVHPRYRTPVAAITVSAVWAMVLAATGTFEQLLTYVIFAGWIFYALGALSIFVFRRRMPDARRPFRVPGYPLTPLLFVLAAGAIVVNTLIAHPVQAFLGLGIVLLGTPVYLFWRASGPPASDEREQSPPVDRRRPGRTPYAPDPDPQIREPTTPFARGAMATIQAEAGTGDPSRTIVIRAAETIEEYAACVALQASTWGVRNGELVPAFILRIANRTGGITAGAFQGEQLLGFVFGQTGIENGRLIHWSHLLAVRPEARGLGLGRRLKEFQRERAVETGVETIYWTYDPLVARNAHLNLRRLGARVREYVVDMYAGSSSSLHDFGTDRFVVAWATHARPESPANPNPPVNLAHALIVNPNGAEPRFVNAPVVRVEVPEDIYAVRASSSRAAARWRASTRRAFQTLLRDGYAVSTFYREPETRRCFYILIATDCGA